jgi:peptidoglycan-associated lipoprotein
MVRWTMVLVALTTVGCKKKPPEDNSNRNEVIASAPNNTAARDQAVRDLVANFEKVHFETDSSSLDGNGKAALEANAQILQTHPELKVEVQGHADERGTVDYNLALGQRRAKAVVEYLAKQGVAPSRLPVVSYGEERPEDTRSGTTAWASNRRAEFRVLTGAQDVQGTTTQ